MEQAGPTLRLRGGDGEVFEVDARRLAVLFPDRSFLDVPAIPDIATFRFISAYREMEATGAPDLENVFIEVILRGPAVLARVVSAAMQLGDDALLNLCLQAAVVFAGRERDAGIPQNPEAQQEQQ